MILVLLLAFDLCPIKRNLRSVITIEMFLELAAALVWFGYTWGVANNACTRLFDGLANFPAV